MTASLTILNPPHSQWRKQQGVLVRLCLIKIELLILFKLNNMSFLTFAQMQRKTFWPNKEIFKQQRPWTSQVKLRFGSKIFLPGRICGTVAWVFGLGSWSPSSILLRSANWKFRKLVKWPGLETLKKYIVRRKSSSSGYFLHLSKPVIVQCSTVKVKIIAILVHWHLINLGWQVSNFFLTT